MVDQGARVGWKGFSIVVLATAVLFQGLYIAGFFDGPAGRNKMGREERTVPAPAPYSYPKANDYRADVIRVRH